LTTATSLSSKTSKALAQMAKKKGIQGWHSMRKEQLVRALLKLAQEKEKSKARSNGKTTRKKSSTRIDLKASKPTSNSRKKTSVNAKDAAARSDSAIAKKIRAERERLENLKNLALVSSLERNSQAPSTDRIVLIVRDAYWLQAYWEITKATVQRAKVALNGSWHCAKPVLRLLQITSDGNTNSVENVAQEIEIHGGVKNWYINVPQPPGNYRIAIGYAAPDGKFHLIAKSNQVSTLSAGNGSIDENWTDITNDVEKYYALSGGFDVNTVSGDLQNVFEEKSRQPMNAPAFERLGSGINGQAHDFSFQVDAHMIVYGSTTPNGSVTIGGEPVRLQTDGSFSLKIDLPDRRQVLPIVASSRDGTQQRTTVLAVERNTKVMEPVSNDIESL
jgi:hypothetical protein